MVVTSWGDAVDGLVRVGNTWTGPAPPAARNDVALAHGLRAFSGAGDFDRSLRGSSNPKERRQLVVHNAIARCCAASCRPKVLFRPSDLLMKLTRGL